MDNSAPIQPARSLSISWGKTVQTSGATSVGDLLLIEFADRLVSCVREMDTVARIGGDEFVVIVSEIGIDFNASKSHIDAIAQKILTTLLRPYQLMVNPKGRVATALEYNCTVSIGVAMFVNDEATCDEILKCADTAMYRAKAAGRNTIRFDDQKT